MRCFSMKRYPVILLAGGQGRRAGNVLKQFIRLHGKPLFQYSLEVFLSLPECDRIIVVVPERKVGYVRRIAKKLGADSGRVTVVVGGRNRRESAMNGLEAIASQMTEKSRPKHVIFHDAARPMLSRSIVRRLEREAEVFGAATIGITAIDLLFRVENGFIEQAVNKEGFYYGFTPQCLPFDAIWEAHTQAIRSGMHHDMDNIELLGRLKRKTKIRIVDEYPNVKLTYQQDIKTLEFLLRHGKE